MVMPQGGTTEVLKGKLVSFSTIDEKIVNGDVELTYELLFRNVEIIEE